MAIKHLTYAAIPLIAASMSVQAATVDQLNRQVQKLNQRIAEQDQRLRVNGFATFGMSVSDEEVSYNGVNDEPNFGRPSKIGVQMTFNIDDQNSVVTQLVSRGQNSWNTEAEWAYFKHDFNNGLSAKVGRIRLPAFMLSEFLDVGYATPWAKMPNESYSALTPFANMEGVDLSYTTDIGDLSATVQLVYGRSTSELYDLKGLVSTTGSLQADTWNAKLSYSIADDITVTDEDIKAALGLYGSATSGIGGSFTSVGFTYDPGSIYFSAEATSLEVDDTILDIDSAHATIGYRFGRLMPTLTFATAESKDNEERDLAAIIANNPVLDADSGATLAVLMGAAQAFGAGDGSTSAANIATVAAANSSALPTATGTNLVNKATFDGSIAAAKGVIGAAQSLQAQQDTDTTRIALGLRYDVSPGTALKFQYDIIETNDEPGLFDAVPYLDATTKPDKTNILTISLDTVF
ncbi:MAG: hypothetical protein ACI843_002694 [Psychrobacter glaciei]|jgi:hypothetical protein